jgi:NitT/TauT family transport system substrate-binding protein
MKIKVKGAILSSLLVFLILSGYLYQAGFLSHGASLEKITIGSSFNNMNGLLYITLDKGLDKGQGLELTMKPYQSGRDAVKDVKVGLVDLACIGEFVLVNEILAREADLRCPCAISAGDSFDLIARRGRGISKTEDLRDKIIGVPLRTQGEFFLGRLLTFNHIALKEVTVVDVGPSQMAQALAAGKVDAVLWVPPFTQEIINQMGDDAIALKAQGGQDYYVLLATREEYLKARPAAVAKLMRALEQAADFLKQRPGEASAIISKWAKVSVSNLDRYTVRYEVFLDQSLLLAMEDEASWMIKNRLTDQTKIPNFMDYLDPDPLIKVDPKAVRLVIPGKLLPK